MLFVSKNMEKVKKTGETRQHFTLRKTDAYRYLGTAWACLSWLCLGDETHPPKQKKEKKKKEVETLTERHCS